MTPTSAAGPGRNYFKLQVAPGHSASAGAIELRNPTGKTLHVALAAVDGLTLDTLGSAYAPAGSPAHGSTTWLRVGSPSVTLAPGTRVVVPISVAVPGAAAPGDYLSGVSIEALNQKPQHTARGRVSIASVDRYAIGVEVSLPGARRPAIQFTVTRMPLWKTHSIATGPGLTAVMLQCGGTKGGVCPNAKKIEPNQPLVRDFPAPGTLAGSCMASRASTGLRKALLCAPNRGVIWGISV